MASHNLLKRGEKGWFKLNFSKVRVTFDHSFPQDDFYCDPKSFKVTIKKLSWIFYKTDRLTVSEHTSS